MQIQSERELIEKDHERQVESLKIRLFHSLREAKKYDEAEKLYHEVVTEKEGDNSDDPRLLDLRQSFAGMLLEQKKFDRAELISRAVWDTRKDDSCPLSEEAKKSHRQLCSILASLQKFNEAENMHRAMYHKETLDAWALENGEAVCQRLAEQGEYEKAKFELSEIWKIRWKKHGPREDFTIQCGVRIIGLLEQLIASVDSSGGGEAKRRLSDIRKRAFESELEVMLGEIWETRAQPEPNADILDAGHKLGVVLFRQGRFVDAEWIFVSVWENKKQNLGVNDISAMSTGSMLGKTLQHQGKSETIHQAIDILHGIWLARQSVLKLGDAETITTGMDLAQAHCSVSDWQSAEPVYRWIVDQKARKSSKTSPETIEARWNLGQILYNQGSNKNQEAEIVLGELYQEWKTSSPGAKATLKCGHMLAHSLSTQESKVDQTLEIIRDVFKSASAKQDIFYLDCGRFLAALLLKAEAYIEAEKVLRPLWKYPVQGPEEDRIRLRCGNLYGQCLFKQHQYVDAREIVETTIEAQKELFHPADPQCAETQQLLEDVNDQLKEIEVKETPTKETPKKEREARPRPRQRRTGLFY